MPRTPRPAVLATLTVLFLTCRLPAQPPAAKAADKDKDGWKKLFDGKSLEGWKASDFVGSGKVHVKDGAIVMETGSSMTGITYAGKDFPRIDYEVTFESKKLAGRDFFCTTTFPVGEDYCSFVVGGWGGTTVGLSSIDSEDASSNETSKSKEFNRDQWYRVRLRITKPKIEAWIDDEKLVDLETADRRISIRIECRASCPFGLCTWETSGAVRDLRVRQLTDADKKAPGDKKPGQNK
jgi:3-keto-disaccharide hydrolase